MTYTPTTDEVEHRYAYDELYSMDCEADHHAFRRWLAAHDAEVRAQALRDAADEWDAEAQHELDGMPDVFSGLGRERSSRREEAWRLRAAAHRLRDRADQIERGE